MKHSIKFSGLTVLIALIFTLISCEKDNPVVSVKDKLMSKTWQVNEVINYYDGMPTIEYKRGSVNDDTEDTWSMVRYKYNQNGSVSWTDSFGESGTSGAWQLLDNDRKLSVSYGFIAVTYEDLQVTDNTLSYTMRYDVNDYTVYKYVPVP